MDNGYVDVMGFDDMPNGNNVMPDLPSLNKRVNIDRIREERINPQTGEHEYLIKWKAVKESWENANNIGQFPEIVQVYEVILINS